MNEERDLADELWEHRNDPDEWSEEPEVVESRPSGSAVVSFRIPWEELEELDEAATAEGESLSEFLRIAIRARLKGMVAIADMTYGGAKLLTPYGDIPALLRGTEASPVVRKSSGRDMAGTTL